MTGSHPAARPGDGPLLEVVAGQPTAEELAALTAALSAMLAARQRAASRRQPAGGWADRSRLLRTPQRPGPQGWRRSAR
jgi:acyl-CoA carboxylase epsilon subunit